MSDRSAVVTVSFRSEQALRELLVSLRDQPSDAHPLVVVVDNAPHESERMSVLRTEFEFVYVAAPDNPGYGGAVNRAVSGLPADIDWVLITNPDVELRAHAIDVLIDTAQKDSSIAAIGPAVLNSDGTVYPSARNVPSVRNGIGHVLFSGTWPGNPWSRAYHADTEPVRRDAGWLSGSCVLVRRSAFADIGGFDEGYFMYFEDVDLGYRFGRSGWRNVYEPAAAVVHTGAHSTADSRAEMLRAHHESARRFLRMKYRDRGPFGVVIATGLGLAIRMREALVIRASRTRS